MLQAFLSVVLFFVFFIIYKLIAKLINWMTNGGLEVTAILITLLILAIVGEVTESRKKNKSKGEKQ